MPDLELNDLRTLLDFGMVVVLWLVQLVIYPSFLRCELSQLVDWHRSYTRRVAWVVIPLMFAQLPIVGWLTREQPSALNLAALAALLVCWILTFTVSVPLHRRIDSGDTNAKTVKKLIRSNWPRTFLWSLVFALGLFSG
ncbi:MAG: hypothetical protein ACLFU4_03350 [Opitutales bacterium]